MDKLDRFTRAVARGTTMLSEQLFDHIDELMKNQGLDLEHAAAIASRSALQRRFNESAQIEWYLRRLDLEKETP